MTLQQRQLHLMQQISKVKDEQVLELLEEELNFYVNKGKDIFDDLSEDEINELVTLAQEPEKDIVSEEEYLKATARWRTR